MDIAHLTKSCLRQIGKEKLQAFLLQILSVQTINVKRKKESSRREKYITIVPCLLPWRHLPPYVDKLQNFPHAFQWCEGSLINCSSNCFIYFFFVICRPQISDYRESQPIRRIPRQAGQGDKMRPCSRSLTVVRLS